MVKNKQLARGLGTIGKKVNESLDKVVELEEDIKQMKAEKKFHRTLFYIFSYTAMFGNAFYHFVLGPLLTGTRKFSVSFEPSFGLAQQIVLAIGFIVWVYLSLTGRKK